INAIRHGDINSDLCVLMTAMDGAQLYKDKESDCWLSILMQLNLGEELRYKKKHVLPNCCIPGPGKPKHMDSFMFPTFHHISTMQKEGLKI
ncbi:hypothetical protein K439DRAFT_1267259, partial [Ramaria rubella]